MLKVLSYILCDLDPNVKVIGQKAGICDGVPSTSDLVELCFESENELKLYNLEASFVNSCYHDLMSFVLLLWRTVPQYALAF